MKRILIVEDAVSFRDPVAATLRRQGYEVDCESNGGDALQRAWSQCPDLILLDIAMPGMDGLTCLRELRNNPRTARVPVIMLTAMSEREAVKQAIQAGAQGYLLKSHFSLDDLLSRVRVILKRQDGAVPRAQPSGHSESPPKGDSADKVAPKVAAPPALDRAEVLERINKESQLRAVPVVLQQVLALTNSNRSSFDDVAEAVRQDYALALKVMRMANSSFFGTGRAVQNLTEAGQRIGMSGIRNTIATIVAIEHFSSLSPGGLNPQRFWEHSLSTAVLADLINQRVGAEEAEHLFLAGLLHDIGRFVLSMALPKHYKWIVQSSARPGADLAVVEREVLGLTHGDVTKEVLDQWQTPGDITEAAWAHELPVEQIERTRQDPRSTLIVALANRLAHALATGDSGDPTVVPIHEHVKALTMDGDAVRSTAQEASTRVRDMQIFYGSRSDQSTCEPLAQVLAREAEARIKLAVLASSTFGDPLSLFFEQLGWLDSVTPSLAVLYVLGNEELTRRLGELWKLEEKVGRQLAVLVASPSSSVGPPPAPLQGRPCATVQIPIRYDELIATVSKLHVDISRCAPV